MRATCRLSLTLVALGVVASACGSGSTGAPGTTTVTATVTATPGSSATMTPPHVIATPSEGTATSTGTPRCDGPSLAVSLTDGGGAAGTIYFRIGFTNRGSATCYLQGFPGVSAADASGKAKVDARRDTTAAARRVVLAPGRSAHANLAVRNVPPSSAACPSYPLLLVTPPDSRRTTTISRSVQPCANQMRITVVQAGSA
jgi:Domain of unknown function (DUF4232)